MLLKRLISLLALIAFTGCASGYHCYPCGQVSCDYCPPNPLPYAMTDPCNCQDSIGQKYLANSWSSEVMESTPSDMDIPPNQDYYTPLSGKNE